MKKVLIILGLLLLCLFVGSVSAMSGSGTVSDPYILTTSSDLQALSGTGILGYGANAYYELGADIDMSGVASFTPIGTNNIAFIGHFDGKNHTISGLKISNLYGNTGLFSDVGSCDISNIIFIDSNVEYIGDSSSAYTGILIGSITYSASSGLSIKNIVVDNCSVSGRYDVSTCIGFISDLPSSSYNYNIDNIKISNALITHSGAYAFGFVVGFISENSNSQINITNCNVINSLIDGVNGNGDGSIVGAGNNCNIINCVASNCYLSGYRMIGGIIGSSNAGNQVTITNCSTIKCTLIAEYSYVGGMCGSKRKYALSTPLITNCSVLDCSMFGETYIGGVFGGNTSS